MKSGNRPGHITKGDVFDDLGLPRSEASALKVKATLLDAILREIEKQGYYAEQPCGDSRRVSTVGEQPPARKNRQGERGEAADVVRPADDEDYPYGTGPLRNARGRANSFRLTRSFGCARSCPLTSRSPEVGSGTQ